MKIIFDYNRTLFNPETDSLYQGVVELLQSLSKNNELFLVSLNEPERKNRFEEMGVRTYFKSIIFVDKKTTAIFKKLIGNENESDGEVDVFVVGDRIKGEIFLGNQLGFVTIWVQQGKFSIEIPEKLEEQPNYTVKNILEVRNIISKYEK